MPRKAINILELTKSQLSKGTATTKDKEGNDREVNFSLRMSMATKDARTLYDKGVFGDVNELTIGIVEDKIKSLVSDSLKTNGIDFAFTKTERSHLTPTEKAIRVFCKAKGIDVNGLSDEQVKAIGTALDVLG